MGQFQYDIVAKAIDDLVDGNGEAGLDALAAKAGYEPTHFQKLFKDHVGISPKRVMQYMSYTKAREFLLEGYSTLEAAYQAGLSGGGRLHDLFVSIEAATPGVVQQRGAGMEIAYGYHPSPLGEVLIAQTEHGVCWMGFVPLQDRAAAFEKMQNHWPAAEFREEADKTVEAATHLFRIWKGQGNAKEKLRLDLQGTNFQIQVWRALLKIPSGAVMNYGQIAQALGDEKASRAVGTAVGANPVALLIPCHRVIQKSGIVENYAWGSARKKMLLGLEGEHIAHGIKAGALTVQPLRRP